MVGLYTVQCCPGSLSRLPPKRVTGKGWSPVCRRLSSSAWALFTLPTGGASRAVGQRQDSGADTLPSAGGIAPPLRCSSARFLRPDAGAGQPPASSSSLPPRECATLPVGTMPCEAGSAPGQCAEVLTSRPAVRSAPTWDPASCPRELSPACRVLGAGVEPSAEGEARTRCQPDTLAPCVSSETLAVSAWPRPPWVGAWGFPSWPQWSLKSALAGEGHMLTGLCRERACLGLG